MRWLSKLWQMTRNGVGTLDLTLEPSPAPNEEPARLGTVSIHGHGGLTGEELASAGASIAAPPELMTVDDVRDARERLEAFIERAATDVSTGTLRGSYWNLQSAQIDPEAERWSLASEMERLGRVEGAAVVGWVIRNAAIRAQRPIARLARDTEDVSADALELAGALLDSPQRLDPTYGGLLFSSRRRHDKRWRFRGRFGHLWIYGD